MQEASLLYAFSCNGGAYCIHVKVWPIIQRYELLLQAAGHQHASGDRNLFCSLVHSMCVFLSSLDALNSLYFSSKFKDPSWNLYLPHSFRYPLLPNKSKAHSQIEKCHCSVASVHQA